jgi:sugar phosphate isomerase/epimerase
MKIGLKLWSINTDFYLNEAKRLYDKGIYDYIELYVVPETLKTLPLWKDVKHIPFVIHNPHFAHGFNLANREKEKSNIDIYLQVKKFADELNAEHIIFHGGIDGNAEETVRQLKALNEPRALIENKPLIAIPNRMGGCFCRGATSDELEFIIDKAKCGFCFDIGHAVCSANSQKKEPYGFLHELMRLGPTMFHLSDVKDITSPYDDHPHLGTGQLDISRLKREIFGNSTVVSVETNKDSKKKLDDFERDAIWLKNL